jgi:anthranilate phosphoribosyltransferase
MRPGLFRTQSSIIPVRCSYGANQAQGTYNACTSTKVIAAANGTKVARVGKQASTNHSRMTSTDNEMVATLERAIRAYLAAHPSAADSAVGIQRWWLPDEIAFASITELVAALRAVVATGELAEHHLPDGSVIYTAVRPGDR